MNVKEYAKRLAAHRGTEWLCGGFPHEAKELVKLCGESADDNTLDLLQAMLNDQAKLQAERDRLAAENQRLRDALEKVMQFADEDKYWLGTERACDVFEQARQALEGNEDE